MANAEGLTPWHRLFGLVLTDLLRETPFVVDIEKDLALQAQRLDVLVVRGRAGYFQQRLPDGLGDLAEHNLITFKSHRDALDGWAVEELVGHYADYRKQVSPSADDLLPAERFRLYAVAARFPDGLAEQVPLQARAPGVYEYRPVERPVRVLVLSQLPCEEHNAALHLFTASRELVSYGAERYRKRNPRTSGLLNLLLRRYQEEESRMSYTWEDFERENKEWVLKRLTPEERLQGLPAEERLQGLPAEERVRGLTPEERLKGLPAEERLKGLPAEERLKGLPAEERLKGLSARERLQGLSPEELRALLRDLGPGDTPPG